MTATAELTALEREVKRLKRLLAEAGEARDEAEQERDEAGMAAAAAEERLTGLVASLRRYVWRDDRPGATYYVHCEWARPLHRHDCPFGMVD